MPRTHDRSFFYKFTDLAGARKILAEKSLLWKSPDLFNDPFDTQTRFATDTTADSFAETLARNQLDIIFSDPLPTFYDPKRPLHAAGMLLRLQRENLDPDEIARELLDAAKQSGSKMTSGLRKITDEAIPAVLHSRVMCLTEEIDNVVMWSHYADEHRGIGLKFRCLDNIDHPFIAAKAVEYSNTFKYVSGEYLANYFCGLDVPDLKDVALDIVYVKHEDWAYEKEWRVWWPLRESEPHGDGKTVFSEPAELFEAIYLGCRMKEPEISEVIELAAATMPDTEIYMATKNEECFGLSFSRLRP